MKSVWSLKSVAFGGQGNNPNSWTTSRQYLKGPGGDGSRACPAWPNRNCGWLWPVKFRRNEQGIHQRNCSQNDPVWRTSNTCSLFASRCVSVCVRETMILPVYPQKFNLEPSRTNKFHLQNCFPKAVSLFRMSFQGFMSHYELRTSRRWADHWGVGSPWASSSLDLSQGLSWRSLTQPDAARPSWKSVASNGSGGCMRLLGFFWFFMVLYVLCFVLRYSDIEILRYLFLNTPNTPKYHIFSGVRFRML